jgi:hypothetical protein
MPGMDERDRQYRDATVLNHGERRKSADALPRR